MRSQPHQRKSSLWGEEKKTYNFVSATDPPLSQSKAALKTCFEREKNRATFYRGDCSPLKKKKKMKDKYIGGKTLCVCHK